MKKLMMVVLLAASAGSAHATAFNYTLTYDNPAGDIISSFDGNYPVHNAPSQPQFIVSGTFDGDLTGTSISNMTNITLNIDGHQISGPIYAFVYDNLSNQYFSNATWSLGISEAFNFVFSAAPTLQEGASYLTGKNAQQCGYYGDIFCGGYQVALNDDWFTEFDFQLDEGFANGSALVTLANPIDPTTGDPTHVPEPAMLGLFGMGALALGLSRRRKA